MIFKKTAETDQDLIDIYLYGFINFGEQQVEKYYAELGETLHLLAANPYLCRERKEFKPPVRIHRHNSHSIIYTIEKSHILIIRILHKSMDVEQHL